jgi:predicted TIM-barrel fold metal-dependent hydrolase
MAASTAPASGSGLYANPREDWLAQYTEEIIDPSRPIVDPHHHLWDRGGLRYMIEEMAADIASGHNIIATVYVDCRSMYRAHGPEAFRPVGEVEFANGVAAMAASGGYGKAAICAGIVSHVNLLLGDGAKPVLEAEIAAGNGRFRGIRHSSAWDADPDVAGMYATRPKGLLLDSTFRKGFACLAPLNLSFDAWLFHPQIGELTDLARAFPDTKIVLDHCGGPAGIGSYAGRARKFFRCGRPRSRKSRHAKTSSSSSAGSRCACSATIFTCGRNRPLPSKPPPRGVPTSKPASRRSGPIDACSRATFRRIKASAAIR